MSLLELAQDPLARPPLQLVYWRFREMIGRLPTEEEVEAVMAEWDATGQRLN